MFFRKSRKIKHLREVIKLRDMEIAAREKARKAQTYELNKSRLTAAGERTVNRELRKQFCEVNTKYVELLKRRKEENKRRDSGFMKMRLENQMLHNNVEALMATIEEMQAELGMRYRNETELRAKLETFERLLK